MEKKRFKDGDKVKLNVDKISGRKDFEVKSEPYSEFVLSNRNTVFTAKMIQNNIVCFEEDTRWLFWDEDLEEASNEEVVE